jgi:hypothetical protein
VPVPAEFVAKLKGLNDAEKPLDSGAAAGGNVMPFPRVRQPLRLAAMAAVLVLAVGFGYSALFTGNQPSTLEMALGRQAVEHIYLEQDEIDARQGVSVQLVSQIIADVGVSLAGDGAVDSMQINFAKPCIILPEYNSAHLVMEGSRGAISVIVIDNSPVTREFTFSDDRYTTVVAPFENGNLILVGERDETLATYRDVVTENMEWVI